MVAIALLTFWGMMALVFELGLDLAGCCMPGLTLFEVAP